MAEKKQAKDPGIGAKYNQRTKRIINKDGTFNVTRKGAKGGISKLYRFLINVGWWQFFGLLLGAYILVNLIFASVYFALGTDQLAGVEAESAFNQFLACFHFSAQTLTTVGYGSVSPTGAVTSLVSSFESFLGLISFAFATGLLYGRFDRPRQMIVFSKHALISKNEALKFRVANERDNILINITAKVLLVLTHEENGQVQRQYFNLPLVTDRINFLPLNWTVVHEMKEGGPMLNLSAADLQQREAEILILVSAFDDTYNTTVHARHSYRFNELRWDEQFTFPYEVDDEGQIVMDLKDLNNTEKPNR